MRVPWERHTGVKKGAIGNWAKRLCKCGLLLAIELSWLKATAPRKRTDATYYLLHTSSGKKKEKTEKNNREGRREGVIRGES